MNIRRVWQQRVCNPCRRVWRRSLHTWDCVWCAGTSIKPPFALWYSSPSLLNKKLLPVQSLDETFFLFPYGLRIYAWTIAVIYCVLLFRSHPLSAVFSFVFIVFIIPMLLFVVLRIPVLCDVHKSPERHMTHIAEILDAISLIPETKIKFPGWFGFCQCFPVFRHHRSLAWRSHSSWPQAFIVQAYREFFSVQPPIGPIKSGAARFFIFHFWPAWSSGTVLFLLMLPATIQPMQLVWLGFLWLLFAIFFSIKEIDASSHWMILTREDTNITFPWRRGAHWGHPPSFSILQRRFITLGIGLALTLLAGAFLGTVKIYADHINTRQTSNAIPLTISPFCLISTAPHRTADLPGGNGAEGLHRCESWGN